MIFTTISWFQIYEDFGWVVCIVVWLEVTERSWDPLSPLYMRYCVPFPGIKWPSVALPIHPYLVPSLRHSTAIGLLSLWNFMACYGLKITFWLRCLGFKQQNFVTKDWVSSNVLGMSWFKITNIFFELCLYFTSLECTLISITLGGIFRVFFRSLQVNAGRKILP